MRSFLSIILALSILFAGCASNSLRKQRKHYKKATSGVKYSGYKTASKYALSIESTWRYTPLNKITTSSHYGEHNITLIAKLLIKTIP